MSDLYQEVILEEYRHPQHRGLLAQPDVSHGERNASCGDQLTVTLKISPAKSSEAEAVISEIGWEGEGCAISMASMSVLSAQIIDQKLSTVLNYQQKDLEEWLGLEDLTISRQKCLLLGLEAVKAAIQKWQEIHMPQTLSKKQNVSEVK